MPERKEPAAKTCRYHCVPCCLHFRSLIAFDAHIRGGEHIHPREARSHKTGQPLLGVQCLGECRLSYPDALQDVELWEGV